MRHLLPLLLSLPLLAGAARAGEIVVTPEVTLTYADPPGFCPLNPEASDIEAALFQMAQRSMGDNKTVRLVRFLVDCAFLETAKSNGAVAPTQLHGVGWALEVRDGAPYESSDDRRGFVAARGQALRDNIERAIKLAAEKHQLDPSQVTDTTLDDSDPEVFVLGVTVGDPSGPVGVAFGITLIQGYGVMPLSLRSPVDPAGLAPQVAEVRALAHDLIQRNDPTGEGRGGWFAKGLPGWVVGGVIGVAVVFFLNYRRANKQRARNAALLTPPPNAPS